MAVIDCTLDSFSVPGFSGFTPEFGTKKADDTPITSREANVNIMMPFMRQRPKVVSENSSTTDIEAATVFNITAGSVTLTLGSGSFAGCEVKAINSAAASSVIVYTDGQTKSIKIEAGETMRFEWNGAAWKRLVQASEIIGANPALTDESRARNLLDVLGIRGTHSDDPATPSEIASCMSSLRTLINADAGEDAPADFTLLREGDYLDLPYLNDQSATYTWDAAYKNLRIMICGFNIYKGAGDVGHENTKNHIVFQFRNPPLRHRMNPSNTNAGGYPSSEMRTYLEGPFKTGLEAVLGDYLYPVNIMFWNKGNSPDRVFLTCPVFLPSEFEVYGAPSYSSSSWECLYGMHYPIYRDSKIYQVKRYNGSRVGWFLSSPSADSAAGFCGATHAGTACGGGACAANGAAPAFCVA